MVNIAHAVNGLVGPERPSAFNEIVKGPAIEEGILTIEALDAYRRLLVGEQGSCIYLMNQLDRHGLVLPVDSRQEAGRAILTRPPRTLPRGTLDMLSQTGSAKIVELPRMQEPKLVIIDVFRNRGNKAITALHRAVAWADRDGPHYGQDKLGFLDPVLPICLANGPGNSEFPVPSPQMMQETIALAYTAATGR